MMYSDYVYSVIIKYYKVYMYNYMRFPKYLLYTYPILTLYLPQPLTLHLPGIILYCIVVTC